MIMMVPTMRKALALLVSIGSPRCCGSFYNSVVMFMLFEILRCNIFWVDVA